MTSLIERLRTAIDPVRYNDLARRAQERDIMRQEQPWLWERAGVFTELDDRMIDMMRRLKDFDIVYGALPMTTMELSNTDRLEIVQRSRIWYAADPLISHAVELWTAYGFGQQVSVTASDENAQAVWDAFWEANERVFGDRDIHEMSDSLLTDGEIWLACYIARPGGAVQVRVWPTEQITSVVCVEGDQTTPLYYQRTWRDATGEHVRWYPDYQADEAALRRAALPTGAAVAREEEGTVIKVMPVQFKRLGAVGSGWRRGWPLTTAALDWARAYRQFCEDRAAVARKIASEIETFKAKGGQRGIEAMAALQRSSLTQSGSYTETNPPAGAGSVLWINDAVERMRMSMSTGAQDAATDSMLLIGQVATALGLPAFMLGRTDMLQNRATAEAAMQPTLRTWNSYQLLWRDVFADLFNLVLDAQQQHAPLRRQYTERGVTVELSSPIDTDYQMIAESLNAYWDRGIIQPSVISRLAMGQPELGLSPETVESIIAAMYPGEQSETDKREAIAAMIEALREGRVTAAGDGIHWLGDGHEH